MMRSPTWLVLLTAATWAVVPTGCEPSDCMDSEDPVVKDYPQQFLQKDWPKARSLFARTVHRSYKIRPGDKLEIIYFFRTFRPDEVYRLKIRDILSVRFPFNPSLDVASAEVQSDGTIQLPLVNSVYVFDKTVNEIHDDLTEAYALFLKKPVVSVSLSESKRDIDDLREAITTSPRGQSRLVPVTPDGTIALPLLPRSVLAGGKTVDEVRQDVQRQYKDLNLPELEVTINLEAVAPLRAYVLGEVRTPGVVLNETGTTSGTTQLSLLQALAQAGGYDPKRAELSKVLLIRYKNVPSPQVAVVNVRDLLMNHPQPENGPFRPDGAKFRHDIWLDDGDVVYVPTTALAKRADYIEYVWTRGIYAVFPVMYSIQATYNAVDAVDWMGPPR